MADVKLWKLEYPLQTVSSMDAADEPTWMYSRRVRKDDQETRASHIGHIRTLWGSDLIALNRNPTNLPARQSDRDWTVIFHMDSLDHHVIPVRRQPGV